jgi:uncharacterized RDD family membrane protein YckC
MRWLLLFPELVEHALQFLALIFGRHLFRFHRAARPWRVTCSDCEGLTAAHVPVALDARCARHPEARASFACTRCGSFACLSCNATEHGPEGLCLPCAPVVGVFASRGARFVANMVDQLVILIPIVAAGVAVGLAEAAPTLQDGGEVALVIGILLAVLVPATLQIAAQLHWGQSLGKRMLGIRVVRMDGSPIELWRLLLLRNAIIQVVAQDAHWWGWWTRSWWWWRPRAPPADRYRGWRGPFGPATQPSGLAATLYRTGRIRPDAATARMPAHRPGARAAGGGDAPASSRPFRPGELRPEPSGAGAGHRCDEALRQFGVTLVW